MCPCGAGFVTITGKNQGKARRRRIMRVDYEDLKKAIGEELKEDSGFDVLDDDEVDILGQTFDEWLKSYCEKLDEKIAGIVKYIDDSMEKQVVKTEEFEQAVSDYFDDKHPGLSDSDIDAWDEGWQKLCSELREGKHSEILGEVIDKAYNAIKDSITDDMRRRATDEASEEFGLPLFVMRYLMEKGILPNALC
jgi:hypothetical protein